MNIEERYHEPGEVWHDIPFQKAINRLSPYWQKIDIEKQLNSGEVLWTPFALYRMKQDD